MGTLSFSIGQDFGLLLVKLAREKLFTNFDITEAATVLVESLQGIKVSSAIDIILGKEALAVDVERQELTLDDIEKHPEFKYNFTNYLNLKHDEFKKRSLQMIADLNAVEDNIIDRIESDGTMTIVVHFPPKVIFDNDRFIDINSKINEKYYDYIETVKDARQLEAEINEVDDFMRFLKTQDIVYDGDFLDLSDDLALAIDRVANFEHSRAKALRSLGDFPKLQEYLDANVELANTLKIATPRNLKQWNACWIDRDGNLYGADGTAANYLHLKIAEALVEHDVIPKGSITNPSAWLEKNGWAKMQNNWVTYAGYYNVYNDVLPLSDAQIQMIGDIGDQECYNHSLYVGDRKTLMSATKFKTMDKPLLQNVFKL